MQVEKDDVAVDPEDGRADQKIADRPSADAGDDRKEEEGDERLALLGREQRAGNREDGDAEIVEIDERGWVHSPSLRGAKRRSNPCCEPDCFAPLAKTAVQAYMFLMADDPKSATVLPTLEDWQHWTLVMGRAQQMMMEFWAEQMKQGQPMPSWTPPAFGFGEHAPASDPMALMTAGAQAWAKGLETWGKMLGGVGIAPAGAEPERKDRRFAAPELAREPDLRHHPADLLAGVGPVARDGRQYRRDRARHAREIALRDAQLRRRDEPVELRADQPAGAEANAQTRGENSLKGLANMLKDIAFGQLTQTKPGVFEVGRNLATTPGKVVRQTPLYQLIQYTPTTDEVLPTRS